MNPHVIIVETKEQLFDFLHSAPQNLLVVLEFFSELCLPCVRIGSSIDELQSKYAPSCQFLRIDVQKVQDFCEENNIQNVPVFFFYQNEQHIDTFAGSMTDKLQQKIDTILQKTSIKSIKTSIEWNLVPTSAVGQAPSFSCCIAIPVLGTGSKHVFIIPSDSEEEEEQDTIEMKILHVLEITDSQLTWKQYDTVGQVPAVPSIEAAVLVKDSLICIANVHRSIETYSLDTKTFEWKHLQTSGTPGVCHDGRRGLTATLSGNRIFLIGGGCEDKDDVFNEISCLNLDSMEWKPVKAASVHSGNLPPVRHHTTTSMDPKTTFLVFGGEADAKQDYKEYNEAFLFDTDMGLWNTLEVSGVHPLSRIKHSACLLKGRYLVCIGGENGYKSIPSNQDGLAVLDLISLAWLPCECTQQDGEVIGSNVQAIPLHEQDNTVKILLLGGQSDDEDNDNTTDTLSVRTLELVFKSKVEIQ